MTSWQWLTYGATLLLSLSLGLYVTPFVRRAALRFGVLDAPDGRLKRQAGAVPYLGGIAVYVSFLICLGVIFELHPTLVGLLLGGTIVTMLGLFDDLRVLSPGLKLAGQALAIFALMRSNISIQLEVVPALVALPLSVVWIAGVTNAFNILDVSDGLATGTAAIAAAGLFVIAWLGGDALIATTTLALTGSLVGFLWYNRPPARIYLGDAGSLFIGFMLAALSLVGTYTRHSTAGALAPLLLLNVPILDTVLVTLARLGRGQSPLRGSPDHLAVRLQRVRGWSAGQVALYAYALAAAGCASAVLVTEVESETALGIAAANAGLLVANLAWLLAVGSPLSRRRAGAVVAERQAEEEAARTG